MKSNIIVCLALLLLTSSLHAESPHAATSTIREGIIRKTEDINFQNQLVDLLEAKSLRCKFGKGFVGGWEEGAFKYKESSYSDDPNDFIQLDAIDYDKGTARIIGNAGANNLVVIPQATGVTFLEATSSIGSTRLITVFNALTTKPKTFQAITSNHMVFHGIVGVGSQYGGQCEIWSK